MERKASKDETAGDAHAPRPKPMAVHAGRAGRTMENGAAGWMQSSQASGTSRGKVVQLHQSLSFINHESTSATSLLAQRWQSVGKPNDWMTASGSWMANEGKAGISMTSHAVAGRSGRPSLRNKKLVFPL